MMMMVLIMTIMMICNVIDENVHMELRDKLGEKLQKRQRGSVIKDGDGDDDDDDDGNEDDDGNGNEDDDNEDDDDEDDDDEDGDDSDIEDDDEVS